MSAKYRTKPMVQFPIYRALEARRVDATNMMWASIVGSKIAASTMTLAQGSERTLREIFPTLEHIQRFDMRPDVARDHLSRAEVELSTMGMTYAMALHEDFVKSCLELLIPSGKFTSRKLSEVKTANAHEKFAEATGHEFDHDALQVFHFIRQVRNCHIHAGGTVDTRVVSARAALSDAQLELWEKVTREPLRTLEVGASAEFGVSGLLATLAIGKRLAYDVNIGLQAALPQEAWADIAADEYFDLGAKSPKDPSALRALRGFLRGGYDALELTDAELRAAIDRRT